MSSSAGGGGSVEGLNVQKQLELEIDLGNLLASDPNEINSKDFKANPNEYLKSLTRDNTQLLFNKIWTLPFERVDDVIVVKLPKPQFLLPREKPVPKPKPLTKWETYAKEKGIKRTKKTKLVWDEIVKKWIPRFGYRRATAEHEKDWCLEVPGNVDPYQDQFEKKSEDKSEKVAKNELQRLKNLARARKVQVPSTGLTSQNKPSKVELHKAVHVAKAATASLGKFQAKIPKEKPLRKQGKKRQFDPLVRSANVEKNKNLDILSKLMNKKPKLDIEKAINKEIDNEQHESNNDDSRSSRRSKRAGGGGGGGRKAGNSGKGAKNTKIKKGSARKGSFKKGRAAPKSKPKKKKH